MIALRFAIALGPIVAVLASGLDSELPPPGLVVVVVAFSVAHAVLPDSQLGTTGALLVLGWWALGPVAELPASLLLAAAALVAAHVSAVLVAYGPPELRWSRRCSAPGYAGAALPARCATRVGRRCRDRRPARAGRSMGRRLVAATVGAVVASVAFGVDSPSTDREPA